MNTELFNDYLRRYYYRWYKWPYMIRQHRKVVNSIREKGYANVVLFAANLAMWHLEDVYRMLQSDKRFNTTIILRPFSTYDREQGQANISQLREYFDSRGIPYQDASGWSREQCELMNTLKPDIIFYPQHFWFMFGCPLDSEHYFNRLICYLPYDSNTISETWALNGAMLNRAWRLFYQTDYIKAEAQHVMHNGGKNVVTVGIADADLFIGRNHKDVWKPQQHHKKRIIWAPHWTIGEIGLNRGSFLWLYEDMLRIAKDYSNELQIAFKPHPRLKSMLYDYSGWGRKRTDTYYAQWHNMENGQLEDGAYVDLFMTSDAMVHDSGSFTVQYHYTKNPVLFTSCKLQEVREQLNQVGRDAIDAHYAGSKAKDVEDFLTRVVLGGDDPKRIEREKYYYEYLLPPHGKTVAQNIYDDIVTSLFG